MIQIWLRLLICIYPTMCPIGETQHAREPYNSELECEQAGLDMLRNNPIGLKGYAVYCPKMVKVK